MADEVKLGNAGYTRKRALPKDPALYGSDGEEATVYVPWVFEADDKDGNEERAIEALNYAKVIVLAGLGLENTINQAGVVMEVLSEFGGAVAAPDNTAQNTRNNNTRSADEYVDHGAPENQGAASGGGMKVRSPMQGQPLPDYLPPECPSCGGSEAWDNRKDLPEFGGTRNAKSPHFKCVNKQCGEGFWPPKKGGR